MRATIPVRLGLAIWLVASCAGGDERSPFGLARRPENPTCQAPPRPVPEGIAGLPATLSATGCVDARDPSQPAPGLIPYDVKVPLWSDGASKDRWMALPDGAQISVKPDGDWDLPPGTVLIKTFRLAGQPVETRFFVRHGTGDWSGYSYEWNATGSDAQLLDEGSHRRQIGNVEWHFPSRAECLQCHTPAAGGALGLETAQLERGFEYTPGHTSDQLATLAHIGLFASPPPQLAALPDIGDEKVPLEQRARAYLHANCANCHRPGVGNSGTVDLRYTTPLATTASCDEEPHKGSLGYGPQMRIIAPGAPDNSMLILRMKLLTAGRMPTVASLVVDEAAVSLLSAWITSLTTCPR